MRYFLDDCLLDVDVSSDQVFVAGSSECLARSWRDPVLASSWWELGYTVASYETLISHAELSGALQDVVVGKLSSIFPEKDFTGFSLGRYHKFVSEEEHRLLVDPVLKRFYFKDFPEIASIFRLRMTELLGTPMGFRRGGDLGDHWIILRLNPPCSLAYNPPHKDIYEDFDFSGRCPPMVNAWVPLAGVGPLAGLGLAPGSHLLPESLIVRSRAGSSMNGRAFSVNMIKSWAGSNRLENIYPSLGDILCFSSHLVHGLGVNRNPDETRVALEFRLYRQ